MALRMTSARRSTRSAAGSGPALTALLLVKYLQVRATLDWVSTNLVAFLRWNLLTYRDLWAWIDGPCETPPL